MLKTKLRNLVRYMTEPQFRFLENSKWGFYRNMSDEEFLKRKFKLEMGYDLDLQHPKTFNEKMQWLKIHNRKPEFTTMVDKYEAKKYVADTIGEQYIIPTYGVWDSFDEIDFDTLPDQFVLKCTHDSGGVVIVKDKKTFNKKEAKRIIEKALRRDYYQSTREWPYKDVKHRVFAEKYMKDDETGELRDYKFFCFNGEAKFFAIHFDRFKDYHVNYYDMVGKLMPFGQVEDVPDPSRKLAIPEKLNKMVTLTEKLSVDIPFLRVDLFYANGNIYCGELTFYPDSGYGLFNPKDTDDKLGELIKLPLGN